MRDQPDAGFLNIIFSHFRLGGQASVSVLLRISCWGSGIGLARTLEGICDDDGSEGFDYIESMF